MENVLRQQLLEEVEKRINTGEFDKYLTIPFMTRKSLSATFKGRIDRKVEKNAALVINEAEIKSVVDEAREAAAVTYNIFEKLGFFKQNEDGEIVLTRAAQIALREITLL